MLVIIGEINWVAGLFLIIFILFLGWMGKMWQNDEFFDSINKGLGSNFIIEDYVMPIFMTEKKNNLVFYNGKVFSGYVIIEIHDNGKPKTIIQIKNGVIGGDFFTFFKSGKKKSKAKCKTNGDKPQLHGFNQEFYSTGKLELEGNFKFGKKDKIWKGFYKNGKIRIQEEYVDDVVHGDYKKYDKTGKLIQHLIFVNGQPDTVILE